MDEQELREAVAELVDDWYTGEVASRVSVAPDARDDLKERIAGFVRGEQAEIERLRGEPERVLGYIYQGLMGKPWDSDRGPLTANCLWAEIGKWLDQARAENERLRAQIVETEATAGKTVGRKEKIEVKGDAEWTSDRRRWKCPTCSTSRRCEPNLRRCEIETHSNGLSREDSGKMIQVWSYGGGIQTAAIAVLVMRGELPRPDVVIMADTSREGTATWEYLDTVMRPYLAQIGLTVEVAPHSLTKWDLYYKSGISLPLYHATGKFQTYCSANWKRDVVGRWLRQHGVKRCQEWIGYSYDEIRRVKPDRLKWRQRRHPLVDMILTRADCYQIVVEDAGLPVPPKSACWCCPHRNNREWRFLRDNYPRDWQAAIELEAEVRQHDEVWLHRDRVPIDQADIDSDTRLDVGQCGLGYCFL
jgi:hypothetical protein